MKISDKTRTAIRPDGTKIAVIDGKYSFLIQPSEEDIKNGVRGDHANCMYSLACRRMYHSELVWVTRGVAYVELKNKKGESELQRFILKAPVRAQVKEFDEGGEPTREAVIFARPEGCYRLDAIALRRAKHKIGAKETPPKKHDAYIRGSKKKNHSVEPVSTLLRNPATGMFQFQEKSVLSA